jgi:DNA-directed RNA polymerase subunit RPC12/RpoP
LKTEPKSEIKPSAPPGPSVPPSKPPISLGFKPSGKITDVKRSKIQPPTTTKAVSELVIPSTPTEEKSLSKEEVSAPSDKIFKCVFCGKPVSLEDASVILCPHACGAMGHKEEFLKKGRCAKCKAEIKKIDIEYSELL